MKSRILLLLLSVLIAAPAWAGEAAPAAGGVAIMLKGAPKNVAALAADLEKQPVYQEAGCTRKAAKKAAKSAKIACAKPSGALLDYLVKNASGKVKWSIGGTSATLVTKINGCSQVCRVMACPPPSGPRIMCCPVAPYGPC